MEGLKIRLGEVNIRFGLTLSFSYNDNIFNISENPISDYITRIQPILVLGAGDFQSKEENFLFLNYSPQLEYFAVNSEQDTVNQFFSIAGQYAFHRLKTSASFGYSKDSNPTADQIGRSENYGYQFAWNNTYELASKTFSVFGITADYRDLAQSVDYTTLTANVGLAYQYSPKTRIGFGPQFGITYVDDGGEQPFQGLTLSLDYSTLKKLSFNMEVGVQARQFRGPNPSGQSDFITPTFALGANYQMFEGTLLQLNIARDIQNSSLVQGQTIITDQIRLTWTQRIISRVFFNLVGNYNLLEYQGTGQNQRNDSYYTVSPSLNYQFWRDQMTFAVYYTFTQRSSEIENRDFSSYEVGTSLQCNF